MTGDATNLSRRAALTAAGLAAVAAGFAGRAQAAQMTPEEKAATQVVLDFMKAWNAPAPDAVKLASYVAEECFVTASPGPPAPMTTRAAVAESFKPFLKDGQGFDLAILETAAMGPAVFTKRMDYTVKGGKRVDAGTPAVGLFIVKDGKIKSWHDYAFPKT